MRPAIRKEIRYIIDANGCYVCVGHIPTRTGGGYILKGGMYEKENQGSI